MNAAVRVSGVGIACASGARAGEPDGLADRLRGALSALARGGGPVRLIHGIEEVAIVAAFEALSQAGTRVPLGEESIGIALGVEEGIDSIKADYFKNVLLDGPLGASPLLFPLTAPNTVAARISILMDLRGENHTVCGGHLSGAKAVGLALESLRGRQSLAMLVGGATSMSQESLDAHASAGSPAELQLGCGACFLLLESQTVPGEDGGVGQLLGYGEGFGADEIGDAVCDCLDDAGLSAGQIDSVRTLSVGDRRPLGAVLRRMGMTASIHRSPSSWMYSGAFPLAMAEAIGPAARGGQGPVLIVGTDCLGGAAAALVRGGGA
jgi:hypothetical protein